VNADTGEVCFQLRPGYIRPTSFTKALEEILNLRQPSMWSVLPMVKDLDFPEWRSSVVRVSKAAFRLERPNPNYSQRPIIEEVVEGLHAESVTLRAKASAGESLDSDNPLFTQAMDHVRRRYGAGKVYGEDARGDQSEWHSVQGGVSPNAADFRC
jgi:hypothetical protein